MKDSSNDKEIDSKPPWRPVSVSTLPKADKSALIRAKLLDASRRMRSGRCSVAVQANIEPWKLQRNVSLGAQTDLILFREVGILTDGLLVKRRDNPDDLVLTYSISQMTDATASENASTQTLLPRISAYNGLLENTLHNDTLEKEKLNEQHENASQHLPNSFKTSDLNLNAFNNKKSTLIVPTEISWNFDYDQNCKCFRPYIITPYHPWRSFLPLTANKYLTMPMMEQDNGWSQFLFSFDELIQQFTMLVDIIENLSAKKFSNLTEPIHQNFTSFNYKLPSEYWLPIVEREEEEIYKIYGNYQ